MLFKNLLCRLGKSQGTFLANIMLFLGTKCLLQTEWEIKCHLPLILTCDCPWTAMIQMSKSDLIPNKSGHIIPLWRFNPVVFLSIWTWQCATVHFPLGKSNKKWNWSTLDALRGSIKTSCSNDILAAAEVCLIFCIGFHFNKIVILITIQPSSQWNKAWKWKKRYKALKENNNADSFPYFSLLGLTVPDIIYQMILRVCFPN